MKKNRVAYLVVENGIEGLESYLYTDQRKTNKHINGLNNNEYLFYEFRDTINNEWGSLFQKVIEDKYSEIQLYKDNKYTKEFLEVLKYLKHAIWCSSISFPRNGLYDCEHCEKESIYSDIKICEECGEQMCPECREYREYYPENAHEECNDALDMCNGEEDFDDTCEEKYCYNDECPMWKSKNHDGQTKSSYDENREFIASLDPNDPADAWFFED